MLSAKGGRRGVVDPPHSSANGMLYSLSVKSSKALSSLSFCLPLSEAYAGALSLALHALASLLCVWSLDLPSEVLLSVTLMGRLVYVGILRLRFVYPDPVRPIMRC